MKDFSKLWQRWQRFWEPTDEIPFIVKLLLGVLVVATVAVMVSDSVADCLQQLLSEKYDVLKVIGYCVAGVVSIWLAWAANKRANAIDATAREQVNATKNTEEGQRQERLKNAIEHLGHKRDSVRMGGAYELFHLAKDTEDEDLRQTVMDILCAHIRQMTRGKDYQADHKTKPSEEIQSLLTLLFTQKHNVFEDCSVNLQGSCLNGVALIQARLKRANLWRAQLQGAALWEAQLQGAFLMDAQLQRATIWRAQLQGADLSKAKLQEANLINAQLMTSLRRDLQPQLQGANLVNAQLQGAILWGAQLQGANLSKAQLQGADLKEARLQGVSSQEMLPILSAGFESEIRDRIGKPSDLDGIIFAGGLQQEDLDTICGSLSAEKGQEALREKLRPHIGKPANHELPENSGAETGAYTQEEAEQWIAEYQEAMRGVPKRDDG